MKLTIAIISSLFTLNAFSTWYTRIDAAAFLFKADSFFNKEYEIVQPSDKDLVVYEPPFELEHELGDDSPEFSDFYVLETRIQAILTYAKDWMHPTGFDFDYGVSSDVMGQMEHEEFMIFISFHEGYESTMAGHFECAFYRLTIMNKKAQVLDDKMIAGYEKLKDGGMGHEKTFSCSFNRELSFSIETSTYEWDYEDEGEYENTFTEKTFFQVQQDGMIFKIPE